MNTAGAPGDGPENLLPDQWSELEPLVDKLLDAAPAERDALLVQLSGGDIRRHEALRAMVDACDRELPLLDRPAEERFDQLLMNEPEIALPEVLGDRYRIGRELGRGGMARVYLAHDLKHNRDVAVKVIRPDLAASLGRERFLREIAIAARLRHANIVPLYDSGDANGVLYFVMPYETGQSLRQRLEQGRPLPAREYMSVLRDVARALAYAHEQGVVHRDVKPDNVMLSGGAAVVTDFGIAKAVSIAQGSANAVTLTQTGSGIGTPTYMAPEQAIGDPGTDHRADIYAFGCVAYELISGTPPFHDMSAHQLVAAHVASPPLPLATIRPDVPDGVARLVMRCLAKDPADRPQGAQELLGVLDASATGPASSAAPRRPASRSRALMALGAVGALAAVAATYIAWPRGPGSATPTPEITVAVLPMESIGGDSLQRELADGLSDEVATALVHESGVRVMSRRGVGNYRGQRDLDYEKAGRELGARFLVTGQLRVFDGQSTVGATLHDASDGSILWKESYVQRQAELGVLRDSIAHGIADALRAKLGLRPTLAAAPVTRRRGVDAEAYRLYILGQRALDRRGQSIQASVDNFERAVALDSNYAEAYAGLSLARALSPYFSNVSTDSVAPMVRRAAAHALRLDSTLAPAHVALGLVHQHAYQWDSAAIEYRTAVRLRSAGDVEPLIQYGRHLLFRGRAREALPLLMMARQTEPASALVSSWVSYAFYLDGQKDSALVESERAYQSDTNNITTLTHGGLIRLAAGQRDAARRFAMRVTPLNSVGLYVLASLGDTALVKARLRVADAQKPALWLVESARAYAMLGMRDTAAALTAFEQATDRHEFWASWEPVNDPLYAPLWGSARFRTLLGRVGLSDVSLQPPPGR